MKDALSDLLAAHLLCRQWQKLSMDEYAAEALRAELFGAEAPRSAPSVRPGLLTEESDDELALEENEEGGGDDDHDNLALEENELPCKIRY